MNTEIFDLGKIGITLGYEYNDEVIYEKLTIVLYKGKSYISTKTTKGVSPEQDVKTWQLVAEAKDAYHMLVDAGKTTLTEEEFLEQLVDATKGRYIVHGNVINAADEEDLTIEHSDILGIDTLKLADRPSTDGMGYVILRKNKTFAEQVIKENTIYEIRYDFNLNEAEVTIPNNCILKFEGGSIKNGNIILNDTLLIGNNINIYSASGKCKNKKIYCSWFTISDLTDLICSSMTQHNKIIVDRETTMDGTIKQVNYINIDGNSILKNPCYFELIGNFASIKNISITNFSLDIFLNIVGESRENIIIDLENLIVNGNNICKRFLNRFSPDTNISAILSIKNCIFHNILEFAIGYRDVCKGIIDSNEFYNIGSLTDSSLYNQIAIFVGKDYLGASAARNLIISNNNIHDIQCVYLDGEDAKETHGILLYGLNCIISNNIVKDIYSSKEDQDPGTETEGIYIKGSYNKIIGNTVINAVGHTNSDGAITLKPIDLEEYNCHFNLIKDNCIIINKGIGIMSYGKYSDIIENYIEQTGDHKGAAISFLISNNCKIIKNTIINSGLKITTNRNSAFSINNDCFNLIFDNNNIKCATLAVIYNNEEFLFTNNKIEIKEIQFGGNTAYNSIIYCGSFTPNLLLKNNDIKIISSTGSSLIDCPITIDIINNRFIFRKDPSIEINSYFLGIFRNVTILNAIGNIFDIGHNVQIENQIVANSVKKSYFINNIRIGEKFIVENSVPTITINEVVNNIPNIGSTSTRTELLLPKSFTGFQFFDTDLNKPLYAKEINNYNIVTWVDATGTQV